MGHFYNTVRGKGKDRREAERDAIDSFLYENGNRHDVRDVGKARLIVTVPPMGLHYFTKSGQEVFDGTKPNTSAPREQWLQEWEFELHTHA